MANGVLVKMLLHTKVTRYLEWKCVDGSYVYQLQKSGMFSSSMKAVVHKVPSNDSEALKSPLMGLFEKKRCRDFYIYCQDIDFNNSKTWKDVRGHAISHETYSIIAVSLSIICLGVNLP